MYTKLLKLGSNVSVSSLFEFTCLRSTFEIKIVQQSDSF